MNLANPYLLLLLLIALPLLWLGAKRAKLQKKRFSRYAEAHLLPH
jgi:hypothetical protein